MAGRTVAKRCQPLKVARTRHSMKRSKVANHEIETEPVACGSEVGRAASQTEVGPSPKATGHEVMVA